MLVGTRADRKCGLRGGWQSFEWGVKIGCIDVLLETRAAAGVLTVAMRRTVVLSIFVNVIPAGQSRQIHPDHAVTASQASPVRFGPVRPSAKLSRYSQSYHCDKTTYSSLEQT